MDLADTWFCEVCNETLPKSEISTIAHDISAFFNCSPGMCSRVVRYCRKAECISTAENKDNWVPKPTTPPQPVTFVRKETPNA